MIERAGIYGPSRAAVVYAIHCGDCHGRGWFGTEDGGALCPRCHGAGEVPVSRLADDREDEPQ